MTENADTPGGLDTEPVDEGVPEDAFISPDEPLVHDPFRDALITPEEPLQPRVEEEDEGGVVVGMDGTTEHGVADLSEVALDADRVAAILESVSTNLKEDGITGLRSGPGMSGFEENLRKYLAEYFSTYD